MTGTFGFFAPINWPSIAALVSGNSRVSSVSERPPVIHCLVVWKPNSSMMSFVHIWATRAKTSLASGVTFWSMIGASAG